ncbi:hypothetical protein [Rossellomorea marisflavi]|uniref:hypothetical protein n=1 Tax=Rossellomorea marisflavi TaxID=189381 RepID=UPI0034589111
MKNKDINEEITDEMFSNYNWLPEQITVYQKLVSLNNRISKWKNLTLICFVVVLLFLGLKGTSFRLHTGVNPKFICVIIFTIMSVFFTHAISLILHWTIWNSVLETYMKALNRQEYKKDLRKYNREELQYYWRKGFIRRIFKINTFYLVLKFIISPDYYWAEVFKKRISLSLSQKHLLNLQELNTIRLLKKFYIERSNWFNLFFTLYFVIIIGIFTYIYGEISILLMIFTSCRILSRSVEIIIAFYKDIVEKKDKLFFKRKDGTFFVVNNDMNYIPIKTEGEVGESKKNTLKHMKKSTVYYEYTWKNSFLLPSARTSLALHSLLEVVLIFGCLYFLLAEFSNSGLCNDLESKVIPESLIGVAETGVLKYFIYSFSVVATLPDIMSASYWAIPQFIQILSSLVLVIMSVAYYLGSDYNITIRERELYRKLKLEEIKSKFKD